MSIKESLLEDAALNWFQELRYAVAYAPHLAPGEIASERRSFADVVLVNRLRDAIARLNPAIPSDARDEAVFAGMAKDFLTGQSHGQHMPDHETIMIAGRPFPLFVQTYLGALKSWILIPAFRVFGSNVAALRGSNLFWQLIALLLLLGGGILLIVAAAAFFRFMFGG